MNFSTDRDLLALEPTLFHDVAWVGQQRLHRDDALLIHHAHPTHDPETAPQFCRMRPPGFIMRLSPLIQQTDTTRRRRPGRSREAASRRVVYVLLPVPLGRPTSWRGTTPRRRVARVVVSLRRALWRFLVSRVARGLGAVLLILAAVLLDRLTALWAAWSR
ncbi:MAG: hypothetical protein AAF710_00815 [Planctomycetota bacterium]